MRFKIGPIPENDVFNPETGGWRPCREPGLWTLQLIALLVVVVFSAAFVLASTRLDFLNPPPIPFWLLLLIFLFAVMPGHELVHGLFAPKFGLSNRTTYGFWPKKGVCYAYYDGEMSRNRFLLAMLAPFLVITVLPLIIERMLALDSGLIWNIAFLNAVVSAIDLVSAPLLVAMVPRGAMVRNKGHYTYWR